MPPCLKARLGVSGHSPRRDGWAIVMLTQKFGYLVLYYRDFGLIDLFVSHFRKNLWSPNGHNKSKHSKLKPAKERVIIHDLQKIFLTNTL